MTADPRARSPLAGHEGALDALGAREIPFVAQSSLRVDAEVAAFPLPTEPNTWIRDGDEEILWLGPDEWLVVGATTAQLERRLGAGHHSVVDVSANRAVIELTVEGRRDLLASGCGLDLDSRSWRPGMCAQTLLARVPVLLQERDESTRIFVRPSFSGYLVTWLASSRRAT